MQDPYGPPGDQTRHGEKRGKITERQTDYSTRHWNINRWGEDILDVRGKGEESDYN
jgi:hypothetical protein